VSNLVVLWEFVVLLTLAVELTAASVLLPVSYDSLEFVAW
jgi:hypothetical protein